MPPVTKHVNTESIRRAAQRLGFGNIQFKIQWHEFVSFVAIDETRPNMTMAAYVNELLSKGANPHDIIITVEERN